MAYKPGDYFMICDRCGFKKYASEMKKEWNGSMTCPDCFEEKHPQYFSPTGKHERQTVSPHRPEGEDVFITTPITVDDL